jgi:hypothetical protein
MNVENWLRQVAENPKPFFPFFDENGLPLSPVHAAVHVIAIQGGYTDPWREAH